MVYIITYHTSHINIKYVIMHSIGGLGLYYDIYFRKINHRSITYVLIVYY